MILQTLKIQSRYLHKEDTINIKRCSISLVIRETQIKTTLRSTRDKRMDNTELAKGVKHLEHSHRARKSTEWYTIQ